jgi:hypothetical protein
MHSNGSYLNRIIYMNIDRKIAKTKTKENNNNNNNKSFFSIICVDWHEIAC